MSKTSIICDACCNHMGDRRIIEQMIKSASEIGVDFIKFQAFKAENLNTDEPFWKDKYDYYKSIELKDEDYPFIMDMCKKYKITPMFTVFNKELIHLLHSIGVEYVKIASPDAENEELIRQCRKWFTRVIVSTGMSIMKLNDQKYVDYLYCVSRYPTPYEDIDFMMMQLYDGFSDHTIGIKAAKKAIDIGMMYIERHFTLGKYLPGNDHFFASTPDEIKELCDYRDYKWKCEKYKNRWR